MANKYDNKSVVKAFQILDVLFRNFATGFTQTEITRETGLSSTLVFRYISTLIEVGYVEEINASKRYRPSHRLAQKAVQTLNSLNEMESQVSSSINRITRS